MQKVTQSIHEQARQIAGCSWDDRDTSGTLAEQLRRVASQPNFGSDGDLSADDRAALRSLAALAEAIPSPPEAAARGCA